MKILVVEDDDVCRTMISTLLKEYGIVDIACNGEEAVHLVELCKSNELYYDLIALDVKMPNKNGFDALKEIRDFEFKTKLRAANIIMITSSDDNKSIITGFREQCDSYIIKPITKEKIKNAMIDLGLNNKI